MNKALVPEWQQLSVMLPTVGCAGRVGRRGWRGFRDRSKTSPAPGRGGGGEDREGEEGVEGIRGGGIRVQEEGEKKWRRERRGKEEGGRGRGGGRRGEATSFIYYDASCSVGLMRGEQPVFYVLILQAVCVGWG